MNEISLNGRWLLQYYDFGEGFSKHVHLNTFEDSSWMSACVPGEVHLDLMNAGMIEDPLYGENGLKCQWIEYREWWYRKTFHVSKGFLKSRTEVTFQGLDLTASVWLNGIKIGEHHNAFTACTFDITDKIREGDNLFAVRLEVGLRSTEGKEIDKYKLWDNDYHDWRRVWMRKPQFSFQWDWSPRLLNCGIWRGVELRSYDSLAIRQVHLDAELLGNGAEVKCKAIIENLSSSAEYAELSCCLSEKRDYRVSNTHVLLPGLNKVDITLPVPDAKLWWPRNYGDQTLYNAKVTVSQHGFAVDSYETMYGIREVELLQLPLSEEEGNGFTIAVNGTPVFCQGANWVPADSIIARVSRVKYKELIESAAEANFNMLRVNGVGIYEDPYFYHLCDVHGIMIWQDFMFACAFYPDDHEEFCLQIREEAEWVVQSLYNHASVVLWCGNNENDWLHDSLFLQQGIDHPFFGGKIYHEILPEICGRMDSTRPYWPSSPFGGTDPNSESAGDHHAWQVSLHGATEEEKLDYRLYVKHHTKFCAEFGYLAPLARESLEQYLPHGAMNSNSSAWKYHNNTHELGKIAAQLNFFYKDVALLTFDEYLDFSMAIHAEALKFAVEHFKRRKFNCSGALFWMYADSWGTAGWTIMDYYLNRRPCFYYVKHAFAPLLASVIITEDKLSIWVINDHPQGFKGVLSHGLQYFDGRNSRQTQLQVAVEANSSTEVMTIPLSNFTPEQRREAFYHIKAMDGLTVVCENRAFFGKFNELDMPSTSLIGTLSQVGEQKYEITIDTDSFAWMVKVIAPKGVWVDNNYFDVLGGETRKITLTGEDYLVRQISLKALNTKVQAPVIWSRNIV